MEIEDFEIVCDCILENWQDAAKRDTDCTVAFALIHDGQRAKLTFRDNFPGDFKPLSLGGLSTIRDYCHRHAAALSLSAPDSHGWKEIEISMLCLQAEANKAKEAPNADSRN